MKFPDELLDGGGEVSSPPLPISRRVGLEVQVGWKFTLPLGWAEWAFHCYYDIGRLREGCKVFWPSLLIQILGLYVGFGFYYSPKPTVEVGG